MLGEQNTEPFLRFLTKDMPKKNGGKEIKTINAAYISFENVEKEHCELIYPYGIETKYRILDEYRHLYELSESTLQENGNHVRSYIKK